MNNLLNIKSFLKFLSRNKGYTAIDVFGLSVSLMFVILIAVYVERELNIDKQQANYDRIVAIGNEEFLESGVPVSRFPIGWKSGIRRSRKSVRSSRIKGRVNKFFMETRS